MKLLTYNIHGRIGQRERFQGDRIIRNIQQIDADFVALQEVYETREIERSFLRHLREIGYPTVHYGLTIRWEEGDYGNVILMRGEPEKIQDIDLSYPGLESRGAIRVYTRYRDKPVEIVSTHFGLRPGERRYQTRRLMEVLSDRIPTENHPRVIMGDLNEWNPLSRCWRQMKREYDPGKVRLTFPSRFPIFALDRILVAPPGIATGRDVLRGEAFVTASDHFPVVAELNW